GGNGEEEEGVGIEMPNGEGEEGEVHAEHQELAVSEVHHAHDAEDQREPDGDERVDAAQQDRRDGELRENVYLRESQAGNGIHFARMVVNSSGHTVTS